MNQPTKTEIDDLLHRLQDIAEELASKGWQLASNIVYDIVEDISSRSGV